MPDERPRSTFDIETVLATHWKEVLGADAVDAEDNFFVNGGSSLLAMRLIGRLKKDFQAPVAVRWIFDHPTLAGLTAKLSAELLADDADGSA